MFISPIYLSGRFPISYLLRRLVYGAAFFASVLFIGAAGFHALGHGRWNFASCLYMTIITVSTVGFAETLQGMEFVPFARAWTSGLIVLGSGTLIYFASTLTAFIVEGDFGGALRKRRMQKKIEDLKNHVIVCGAGATGTHVIEELDAVQNDFVVVDTDEERVLKIQEDLDARILYVVGDATDDHTLEQAGIKQARGVIAALTADKDNLFVTISARALNSDLRIVAKAVERSSASKLRRAGANTTVSPSYIGGMRMVSEMVRPKVVEFLDLMLRDARGNLRIEEVTIPKNSKLVGTTIQNANLRSLADVLVIAVRGEDGRFRYNPGADTRLEADNVLVILAKTAEFQRFKEAVYKS